MSYAAHLGGYAFGATVALTLLATKILAREDYDVFFMIRQARRRREINEAVRGSQQRLAGGLEAVRRQPGVPQAGLGAMGFCFGGLSVLDMARADLPGLRAVISIHGILAAPGTPGRPVSASVLALHGWEDPFADPDAVKAFAEEMTAAGADWQLHAYGHARHAFSFPRANKPEMGIVYEPRAAARTWRTIPSFFDETLRG